MRTCDYCGKPIAGKPSKRFCDSTCRMRMTRNPEGAGMDEDDVAEPPSGFAEQVLAELTAAGRENTIAGRNAILMARQLGSKMVNMSGLASLNKEFWRVYELAMAGVEVKQGDLIDELGDRRAAKRAQAV